VRGAGGTAVQGIGKEDKGETAGVRTRPERKQQRREQEMGEGRGRGRRSWSPGAREKMPVCSAQKALGLGLSP
jgi:hypothetical protein